MEENYKALGLKGSTEAVYIKKIILLYLNTVEANKPQKTYCIILRNLLHFYNLLYIEIKSDERMYTELKIVIANHELEISQRLYKSDCNPHITCRYLYYTYAYIYRGMMLWT